MMKDIDSRSLQRTVLTLCMGLSLAVQAVLLPAMAQDFPAKPVRVVVPYSAGGPVDMMARAVSKYMANVSGQPFTVENRGGAGGNDWHGIGGPLDTRWLHRGF